MARIFIFLSLILIISCQKGEKAPVAKKEVLKTVKTSELKSQLLENIKNYNGELKPKSEMSILTPTGGDIEEIYFKNGDKVKKGDTILKISNKDVEASYFEAQGQLLKAKSTYSTEKINFDKYKTLYEREIISESDYLNIKNRYETALGDLKIAEGKFLRAKDNFDRLKIVSEIDGVVTDLYVKKYERVEKDRKIVTIVDSSKMEVDIAIAGKDIKNIKIGNKAKIYVEELGEEKDGVVEEINLSSDKDSKKYSLRLVVENEKGNILKGMYAKVKLNSGAIEGIFVPTKAVMIKDLYSYIAVIRDNKAIIYRVDSLMTLGDLQLIDFPEYKAGDRIVVEGQYLLNNNDRVREN